MIIAPEKIAQLIRLRIDEDLSINETAEAAGVDRTTVIKYTKDEYEAKQERRAEEVRKLRTEQKLSINEVARMTGLSRSTVVRLSKLEGGAKRTTHWKQGRDVIHERDPYTFPTDLPEVTKDLFGWTKHELAEAVRHARETLFPHTNEGLNR